MEALIIFALILLNSIFALSELAIVSARRTRLQEFADEGSNGAKVALALSQQPNRFLATVQVGITLVGVLAGAFGGATLSADVAEPLRRLSPIEPYADSIAFALVVGVTTYLSLVIGELVPKHLALRNPEGIAMLVARPMMALSRLFTPVVWILNQSTNLILWGLQSKRSTETDISENEIIQMIRQGIKTGIFEQTEQELVEDIFRLNDYRVTEIMIPRTDVVWLDMDAPYQEQQRTVLEHSYSYYPVYRGDFDKVQGMVRAKDVLKHLARGQTFNLAEIMHPPLYIPESSSISQAMEMFRTSKQRVALVLDEHGGIEGLMNFNDIWGEMVADMGTLEAEATQREDGSWLLDGQLPTFRLEEIFPELELPPGEERRFATLAGFLLEHFEHTPKAGEHLDYGGLRFEVMDMDGVRIDKVLVSASPQV
jgi:putative hemolysin